MSIRNPTEKGGPSYELGFYIFLWPTIPTIRLFPKIWIDKVEVEEDGICFGHKYSFTIGLILLFTIYLEILS